tara:strand:- start:593 stop:1228 length:636 start_codon:yes stop_codon:yes gene_type:complete
MIAIGASTAMGVASANLQIQGQKMQARMQAKMQENASKVERQRYLNEVSSLRTQQGQEQVAMAQKLQSNKTRAMEARATARVSAGEAGVAGLSVNALMSDLTRKEAMYNNSVNTQAEMLDVRRDLSLRDAGLGFTNNMLRINRPIEEVNYAGALLSGAQTGLSTYSTLQGSGFGSSSPKSAKVSSAPAYKASSAFNVSPSTYTPFKAPTTF